MGGGLAKDLYTMYVKNGPSPSHSLPEVSPPDRMFLHPFTPQMSKSVLSLSPLLVVLISKPVMLSKCFAFMNALAKKDSNIFENEFANKTHFARSFKDIQPWHCQISQWEMLPGRQGHEGWQLRRWPPFCQIGWYHVFGSHRVSYATGIQHHA